MNTKSFFRPWAGPRTRSLTVGLFLMLLMAVPVIQGAPPAELLEKGIYTEETKGELDAASRIYQQIIEDSTTDRAVLAQAQLRLGLCALKLGNKPQAISALERLTQDFPDKDKLLATVEQHMPQLLDELLKQIEQNYIQEVDRGELMETALRAIVGKLDAKGGFLRTNDMEFLSSNELVSINENIDQKIAGIGTILKVSQGRVIIHSPLPGSPAQLAGLAPEDQIMTVDGAELPTNALATAVKLLRGPVGTTVTLGVERPGSGPLEFRLVRDNIRLLSVKGDHYKPDSHWDFMLDDHRKIGYIRLTELGSQSPAEMQTALQELKDRGVKALILDLRNNGGGLLSSAVAVSDLFVERGRIVSVKGRNGEEVHEAKADGTFSGFPVVLLVNRRTASAAEIVAACLQDHQRAVVVGERTYGQGIVRSLIKLQNGLGALKLPVAAYYRPSGKSMNRFPGSKESDDWGVTPNPGFEVIFTDEEMGEQLNNRVQRDILPSEKIVKLFDDRQLNRALDHLATVLN